MAPLSLIRKYSIQSSQNSNQFLRASFYTSEVVILSLHMYVLTGKFSLTVWSIALDPSYLELYS